MVKVSVFLVRHGQDMVELRRSEGKPPPSQELPNMNSLFQPTPEKLYEISERLDPELTDEGYRQAEEAFRSMAKAFDEAGDIRQLAFFSSPYKRCAASALMISSAGFEPEDWSEWALTTPETQSAPTAIPIVVFNGLSDSTDEMRQLGGVEVVADAGLMFCAAMPWNKAYKKDPIMGEVQKMRDATKEKVKEWLLGGNDDTDKRFAADVQYLRFKDNSDPYSLQHMSLKFNIVTDTAKPNKYLPPSRKGMFHEKPPPIPQSVAQDSVDEAVKIARKAGCDAVIMVVTPEVVRDLVARCDSSSGDFLPPAGQIAIFQAKLSTNGKKVKWEHRGITDSKGFSKKSLPSFSPIEPSVEPPEEFRKAMEEAGDEKWGNFPPPEPENVPPDYPEDIPAFSTCLKHSEPTADWAWTNRPEKLA